MANQISALKWLNERRSRGDLRVRQFSWPEHYGFRFFDYEISLNLQGVEYKGRGKDSQEDVAIMKAGAECVERAYCGWNGLPSSGVAAQLTEPEAKVNAWQELDEHDIFFCHLLSDKLPCKANFDNRRNQWIEPLSNAGIVLEIYGEKAGFHLVLAISNEEVVSLGMSYGAEDFDRAVNECLPNAMNHIVNGESGFPLLTQWRKRAQMNPAQNLAAELEKVTFEYLRAPLDGPFVVVRAISSGRQKYLRSGWKLEDVNMDRLKRLGLAASNLPLGKKFF